MGLNHWEKYNICCGLCEHNYYQSCKMLQQTSKLGYRQTSRLSGRKTDKPDQLTHENMTAVQIWI